MNSLGNTPAGIEITQEIRKAGLRKTMLGGRQMWMIVCQFFSTCGDDRPNAAWMELSKVQWLGDERLPEFLHAWRTMEARVSTHIPQDMLFTTLMKHVQESRSKLILATLTFDQMEPGDPGRTHVRLLQAIEKRVAKDHGEKNMQEILAQMPAGFGLNVAKTQACNRWKGGRCDRGDNCPFSHSGPKGPSHSPTGGGATPSAPSVPSAPPAVPQSVWSAAPAMAAPPVQSAYPKAKAKSQAQANVQMRGRGQTPQGRREEGEQAHPTPVGRRAANEQGQMPVCFNFHMNRCHAQDNCQFRHEPMTEVEQTEFDRRQNQRAVGRRALSPGEGSRCKNWISSGACRYGDRCRFLHEEQQGRSDDEQAQGS
jgi:hypothetical protein